MPPNGWAYVISLLIWYGGYILFFPSDNLPLSIYGQLFGRIWNRSQSFFSLAFQEVVLALMFCVQETISPFSS